MSKPDIRLYPAIETAIERYPNFLNQGHNENWANGAYELYHNNTDGEGKQMVVNMILAENPCIIYSKEFAQAFWRNEADKDIYISYSDHRHHIGNETVDHWQFHQINMILADDPLVYLESFL